MTDTSVSPYAHLEPEEAASFARLHPTAITSRDEIRALLEGAASEGVELRRGMNRRILPEVARIKRLDSDALLLDTSNFDAIRNHRIYLNFVLKGIPYFFSAFFLEQPTSNRICVDLPSLGLTDTAPRLTCHREIQFTFDRGRHRGPEGAYDRAREN